MYGNVAPTYSLWKIDGEPYKKGRAYYVRVLHPITKLPKEVRWYTDKAHAATKADPYAKPLWAVFGFKDENDSIQIIRTKDLSQDELENLFYFNWKKGRNWRGIDLYGGAWYAPADEPIPPIAHPEKVFKCDWPTFKAQNKRRCLIMGASKDCVWLKED